MSFPSSKVRMPIVKAFGNRKPPRQYLTTEKLW